MKRSSIKRITRAAKILRYMRGSKGISMRRAGELCTLSNSAINHYEQGRMDISPKRVEQLVNAYGYTMENFRAFTEGKEIPVLSVKDECIALLAIIDDRKLKTVHAVLAGFLT